MGNMEKRSEGEIANNVQTNGLSSLPATSNDEIGKKTILASGYTRGL